MSIVSRLTSTTLPFAFHREDCGKSDQLVFSSFIAFCIGRWSKPSFKIVSHDKHHAMFESTKIIYEKIIHVHVCVSTCFAYSCACLYEHLSFVHANVFAWMYVCAHMHMPTYVCTFVCILMFACVVIIVVLTQAPGDNPQKR